MTEGPSTAAPPAEPFDVVCIGETMVAFVTRSDPRHYLAVTAGAESNVAVGVTQLGRRAQWVSRLGGDPLGDFVADSIAARGVDVAAVRDATRPTGVLTKHVTESRTEVQYYRSESAARALSADDVRRAGPTRWIHVTGITPALSASAAAMVDAVTARRLRLPARVSFDVNHRPVLWPDSATATRTLLPHCRRADVVFIGDDEGQALFGTSDAAALARLILRRDDQELVVKHGARGASRITRSNATFVPALAADVLDVTGAGDAFAAGYLAASCLGWPVPARLRLGHLLGARVVGVLEDVPPPLTVAELGELSPDTLASQWAAR
ncbi:MAG TPA: sugar kinase [Acidimicrobiia bacterium]|nr:sugar kinase [Acidimicrobiia bacterium]